MLRFVLNTASQSNANHMLVIVTNIEINQKTNLLPIFAAVLASTQYAPVDGMNFPNKSGVIDARFTNDIELRYEVFRPEAAHYTEELIQKAIYEATVSSMFEIQKIIPLERRCEGSSDNFLEIYEIDSADLNDSSRFPEKYVGNQSENRGPLLGFYDPRPYEAKVDAIVVSDHGEKANYTIMVHEVAHYWYNTYCLSRYTEITSEEFALKIAGGP